MAATNIDLQSPAVLSRQALTMALSILAGRIRGLDPDDQSDFLELMGELPKATTTEEIDNIALTMLEILENEPLELIEMDLTEPVKTSEVVQKWNDYISTKIRSLRVAAGLTQEALAEKAGLRQSHISRLENGSHSPSHLTVKKIADALGIPVEQIDPSA